MNVITQKIDYVLSHVGFRRYFKNTSWMFFGQFISLLTSFFVGAYVARYLGPTNYGQLSYVVSFVGLFVFLAGFGIDNILNRELVKYPENRNSLIANSFWIKTFGAVLTIIVISILSLFIEGNRQIFWLIFLFSLTYLFQGFGVLQIYFQSQVLSKRNVQSQLIVSLVSTFLKVIFAILKLGVVWFILVFVIESILSAFTMVSIYKSSGQKIVWEMDLVVIKKLLKDSWPLMLTIVSTSIYMKIDQTIIKFMLNEAAVGVYAAAVKLSEIWYFIPNVICASLLPAIINAKKINDSSYIRRLRGLYILMIGIAMVISISATFFSHEIILLLFGSSYVGAVPSFQVYIWSTLPVFLMVPLMQYLIIENYSKIYFMATITGAFANIVLNIYLIPKYNILGSAYSTLISYFVPFVVFLFHFESRAHLFKIISNKYVKVNSSL